MKKLLLAGLAISVMGLTACGGGDKTDNTNDTPATPAADTDTAAAIEFDCSAGWPMCEVNDPETGNVDFVLDAMTGIGGNTMGPLVTADARKDAATEGEAFEKLSTMFGMTQEDVVDNGTTPNTGRTYIVFDSKLNPGQTTYVEVMEKEGKYFACQVSGTFDGPLEAATKGQETCAYMN